MRVKLIMADDIRQEASGKQTVIGLLADDTSLLPANVFPDKEPDLTESVELNEMAAIEQLTFMASICGLNEGDHKVSWETLTPGGQVVATSGPVEIHARKGRSNSLVFQFKPFPVFAQGEHKIRLRVDEEEVDLPFYLQAMQNEDKKNTEQNTPAK